MKRTFLLHWIPVLAVMCVPVEFLQAQVPVRDTVRSVPFSAAADSDPDQFAPSPAGIFDRNLLTPSPDGCALMRSIQVPVDKYTGVANIKVPITEIKAADSTVPVALSYQASGIKVQDVASTVGLGWRLVAGGRITRAVKGWADNLDDFSNRTLMLQDAQWTSGTLKDRLEAHFDTEPDLFYFEYPGGGGMFLFDQNGVPVTIPGQNIRIEYEDGRFRLTDIDGTEYLYTSTESTDYYVSGGKGNRPVKEKFVSTWFLNQIRYADGSLVSFGYEMGADYSYTNSSKETEICYHATARYDASHQISRVDEQVRQGRSYDKDVRITIQNPKYLTWIRYKDYQVEFAYGQNRADIRNLKELIKISVSHLRGGKKQYKLTYGEFANKNLKLLGVEDVSIDRNPMEICTFEYYEDNNLPVRNSYATDHWGYYNGRNGTVFHPETDVVSRVTGKAVHIDGLSKSPSLVHARANSIRRIRYAAGGTKEFQYELHSGRNPATGKTQQTGGLRIAKIIDKSSDQATPSEYTYTYSGGVVYADTVNYCSYIDRKRTVYEGYESHDAIYYLSTQSINEVTDKNGCSVLYTSVTEQLPNGASTVYQYMPYDQSHDADAMLYEVLDGLVSRGSEKEPMTSRSSRHWLRNLLQSETQYDADGSVVQRTSYTYIKEGYKRIYGYNYYMEGYAYDSHIPPSDGRALPFYYVAKYYWDAKTVAVSKIVVEKGRYNLGSTLAFEYDAEMFLPKLIAKTDADGNNTRTSISYPSDYATGIVSDEFAKGIKALKDRNIRSAPIETVVWKNGRVVDASLNLYTVCNTRPVLSEKRKYSCDPAFVRTSFPAAAIGSTGMLAMAADYETVWRAENFDLDNTVMTFVGKGGDRSSVVYGYDNTLPIAIVHNARYGTPEVLSGAGAEALRSKDDTFMLTRRQVVNFHVLADYEQPKGPNLAVCVYDHATDKVCYRLDVAAELKEFDFAAELPAGTYRVHCRWESLTTLPWEARTEVWVGVNFYQSVAGRQDNEVFHTSFEEEGARQTTGNAYVKIPKAKSGEWVCQAPYTIDLSNFKPGSYQLIYWAFYPQSDKPDWQREQTSLSIGPALHTYTLPASPTRYIDEVRILPKEALMTTCTYKPGVGKLSETDPGGVTTHYAYDDAGRLTSVKDGNRNLLKRYTYVGAAKIIEEAINGNAELQQTNVYLDGFGRREQVIDVRATSTFGDLVQFWQYDKMGRDDAAIHLPYALSSLGGARRGNPYGEQISFYNKLLGTLTTHYPYDYTFYDQTPQGKVLKTRSPKDSGRADALYETTMTYGFNTSTDQVRRYVLQQDSVVYWAGHYGAGLLRLEESSTPLTSETDRSRSRAFYNGDDQLVMSETFMAPGKSERTYYIYDDFGRLRYTIPEPGNVLFGGVGDRRTPTDLHLYCYYTVYDRYGRVVKQLNPGAAWVYTLYDCRDRVAMVQKGEMRKENQWIFTYYDRLNRPVIKGVYTGGDFETHRKALEEGRTSYPVWQSDDNVLTEIFYDNYDPFWDEWMYGFAPYRYEKRVNVDGQVVTSEEQANYGYVDGLETGRRSKVLGVSEHTWLNTVNYYDERRQLVQVITDLYPNDGRTELLINHRNAVGNVSAIYVRQEGGGMPWPTGYLKEMTYDHRDRLTKVSMLTFYEHLPKEDCPPGYVSGYDKHNDKVDILRYTYDELGRVKTKSVHNGAETTTYTYDLRGRQLSSESPAFTYRLGYDRPSPTLGTPRYDGLISQIAWDYGTSDEWGYAYTYDAAGQLTAARYAAKSSDGMWTSQDKFAECVTYGTCGRIARIERTDAAGVSSVIQQHSNGYQMRGAVTNGKRSLAYRYDTDGNLVYDGDQHIDVKYNILGLPERLFDNYHEIRYIWTSEGRKIAKALDGSYTYYCNAMEYDSSRGYVPSRIHHGEGFVFTTNLGWEYYYYKKDHVGNVRALLRGSGTSVSGLQRMNYYPFGQVHGSYANLHLNRRLFSGKELEDAALGPQGLVGWYDFGARMYNPRLGRWLSQDPLARKYVTSTPYGYCGNNPICNIDPTGMDHWTVTDPEKIDEAWKLWLSGETEGLKNYFEKNGDVEGPSPLSPESDEYHRPGGSYPRNYVEREDLATGKRGLNSSLEPGPIYSSGGSSLQAEWMAEGSGIPFVVGGIEFASEYLKKSRSYVGSNGKIYRPTSTGRVFRGNQYVTTYSIGRTGRLLGRSATGISLIMTGFQVWDDFQSGHTIRGTARLTYVGITIGVGFIPYVGPFMSLGMNTLDYYYGNQMYQWVEDSVLGY